MLHITTGRKIAAVKPNFVSDLAGKSSEIIWKEFLRNPYKFNRIKGAAKEALCVSHWDIVTLDGDDCRYVVREGNVIAIFEPDAEDAVADGGKAGSYIRLTKKQHDVMESGNGKIRASALIRMLFRGQKSVVFSRPMRVRASLESVVPTVAEMNQGIVAIENVYPFRIISVQRKGRDIRFTTDDKATFFADTLYFYSDRERMRFQRRVSSELRA